MSTLKHLKNESSATFSVFKSQESTYATHKSSHPNYDKTYDRATTSPFHFSRFPYIFSLHQPRVHFLSSASSIISFPPIRSTLLSNPTFMSSPIHLCLHAPFTTRFDPFEFANRIYETSIERFRIDRMASKAREIAFDHVNDAMLRCNVYSIHERPGSFVNLPRSSSAKISICFERESQ